jgi:hypothetical protein
MLGDVYEVVDKQVLFGQEVLNVFQFRQIVNFVTTLSNNAEACEAAFKAQYLPKIAQVQTGDLTHVNLSVKNLFNTDDAFSEDINVTGVQNAAASADTLGSFEAFSFTTRGSGLTVKPGGKRIAAVLDSFVTDGVITDSNALIGLNALANQMKTSLTVGTIIQDATFQPILVKRVRSGAAGNYEYRMPENTGELVYANIQNALLKLLISSQVSRKVGIGA